VLIVHQAIALTTRALSVLRIVAQALIVLAQQISFASLVEMVSTSEGVLPLLAGILFVMQVKIGSPAAGTVVASMVTRAETTSASTTHPAWRSPHTLPRKNSA